MTHTNRLMQQRRIVAPKTEIAMLILKGLLPQDIAEYAGCSVDRVYEVSRDLMKRHTQTRRQEITND